MPETFELGPEIITRDDILAEVPDVGGTEIIVKRHEEYIRDKEDPKAGSLKEEAAQREYEQTLSKLKQVVGAIPEDERSRIGFAVFASPTGYPDKHGGQRSIETAQQDLAAIRDVIKEYDLSDEQLWNNQERLPWDKGPIPSKKIVEPRMFEDAPEFVSYLEKTYGNGEMNINAWIAYEEDYPEVREKRLEMGVESADDMGRRLAHFLYAMRQFSAKYHAAHPDSRLFVLAASHYDTLSPYIRNTILAERKKPLKVDYGGGIGIQIRPDGSATTTIDGTSYPVALDMQAA